MVEKINEARKVKDGILLAKESVARDIYVLQFEVFSMHARPVPGQFFLFDCGGGKEHILRRPLAVHDIYQWEEGRRVLGFLVEIVGWGTRKLCELGLGESVSMLGPLGRGFELGEGKTLLVSGGIGIAPLFFAARELERLGGDYTLVAGFKSAHDICVDFSVLHGEIHIYTEDGSSGKKGLATDGALELIKSFEKGRVIACGPEEMMASVSSVSSSFGIPCEVSLAARMACGVGACRGCVRKGVSRNLCVCTEGPVFDANQVDWSLRS